MRNQLYNGIDHAYSNDFIQNSQSRRSATCRSSPSHSVNSTYDVQDWGQPNFPSQLNLSTHSSHSSSQLYGGDNRFSNFSGSQTSSSEKYPYSSSNSSKETFFNSNQSQPLYKNGTIYFGSGWRAHSLVGGCAWWVVDEHGKILASGAVPVFQEFQNPIRLEYKALFHALNAANMNGVKVALIRGSSKIVLHSIANNFVTDEIPYLSTVFTKINDLRDALRRALNRLHRYDIEYIEPEKNSFSLRLANRIMFKHEKKLFKSSSKNDNNDDHSLDYDHKHSNTRKYM